MPEKRIKLLIVDDEKDICDFEKIYFDKRGLETFAAQTGTKAVALAKRIKPDIALIDIHMTKGVSGIEILKKLMKVSPFSKCVMVTWDKEKAIEAKKTGAVDFLIKPVELPELENSVNRIIKKLKKA